jgi:hypothetical protein
MATPLTRQSAVDDEIEDPGRPCGHPAIAVPGCERDQPDTRGGGVDSDPDTRGLRLRHRELRVVGLSERPGRQPVWPDAQRRLLDAQRSPQQLGGDRGGHGA